jgi:serine/threonine protein kinase
MLASTARREVEIHRSLEHPNIAQLQSYLLEVDYTALVVEYLPHCLFELCRKQHQAVVLPNVPTYARHILLAVAYLHSVGVAHRDIKLENILVTGDYRVAKLCDFGLACFYCAGERSKEHCGSPHYAAPEVLQGASYEPPVADMWSVGVALYATVYAAMPFQQRDPTQLALCVANGEIRFPDHPLHASDFRVPKAWRATLESILDRTPSRRPTAAHALAAPWIQLGS